MNAMAVCADACSNSTGSGLEAFADAQMRIVWVCLWLLFVAVNVALASYVWRGWRDSCGCINKCVWRAPVRAALAAGVNMLFPFANNVFFSSASTSVRTPVGGGPAADPSPLAVLTLVASVAVLACMFTSAYTLLNPRGCHNQPCLLETNTQDSGGDESDAMTLLEYQPLNPGVAWERELSAALAKK